MSGNAQPAVFNRQIAMYLAKHVGGWSTTAIGRFYNGRDHSRVRYALKRVGALREDDPEVDGLVASLEAEVKTAVAELTAQTGTRTQTAAAAEQLRLDEAFLGALADSSPVTSYILDCLASCPQSALAKNADLALIVHDSEHNSFDPQIAAIVRTREAGYAYHGTGECIRHPPTPAGVSRSEASINAPRRPAKIVRIRPANKGQIKVYSPVRTAAHNSDPAHLQKEGSNVASGNA